MGLDGVAYENGSSARKLDFGVLLSQDELKEYERPHCRGLTYKRDRNNPIASRADLVDGLQTARVDFARGHGGMQPHLHPLSRSPMDPAKFNIGAARELGPGEYLSPGLRNPKPQGGTYTP